MHPRTYACIIAFFALFLVLGCASPAGEAAQAFNDYQAWFAALPETDERIDMVVTVRLRAFGSQEDKARAWAAEYPQFGPPTAGSCVSTKIPELWMDLRRAPSGKLILPPHILGHEHMHAAALYDRRLVDSDRISNPSLYAGG